MRRIFFTILIIVGSSQVKSDELVYIGKEKWDGFSKDIKDRISEKYIVSISENDRYGMILSSFVENNSYINNGNMRNLGSAIGQTSYIDNNWDEYSAREQLAAGLLGALVGSTLDKKTEVKFTVTYTVELPDGNVTDIKKVQDSSHAYNSGICIDTKLFSPVKKDRCGYFFLEDFGQEVRLERDVAEKHKEKLEVMIDEGRMVKCKLGNGAPFETEISKCLILDGTIL